MARWTSPLSIHFITLCKEHIIILKKKVLESWKGNVFKTTQASCTNIQCCNISEENDQRKRNQTSFITIMHTTMHCTFVFLTFWRKMALELYLSSLQFRFRTLQLSAFQNWWKTSDEHNFNQMTRTLHCGGKIKGADKQRSGLHIPVMG